MKRISEVDISQLEWKQKRFGVDSFELRSEDDAVGLLYWTKWFSEYAVAKTAHGAWSLDRPGFFRDRVIVRRLATNQQVAHFDIGWFGEGILECADGRRYQWYRTRTFCNYWAFADEQDEVILEIHHGMRWFKHEAAVEIHEPALTEDNLPLLLAVGWYLVCVTIQDAAVVGATTAAVS